MAPDVVARLRAAGCVFAEEEARLLVAEARTRAELDAMVRRRVAGLPLEQIVGWSEFCGLRIGVDPGVFVPRRRTQFLVQQATVLAADATLDGQFHAGDGTSPPAGRRLVVLDMCCGTGAVGVALAASLSASLGSIELYAADVDPVAARCARRNVVPAGGQVCQGDLYEALPTRLQGRVDLLLANAPYVPTEAIAQMPVEARIHEPRAALDGGADGLDVQRRLIAGAPQWLAFDGHLLVETSSRQAPETATLVTAAGMAARVVVSDELSATVVIASMPAATSRRSRRRPR